MGVLPGACDVLRACAFRSVDVVSLDKGDRRAEKSRLVERQEANKRRDSSRDCSRVRQKTAQKVKYAPGEKAGATLG